MKKMKPYKFRGAFGERLSMIILSQFGPEHMTALMDHHDSLEGKISLGIFEQFITYDTPT